MQKVKAKNCLFPTASHNPGSPLWFILIRGSLLQDKIWEIIINIIWTKKDTCMYTICLLYGLAFRKLSRVFWPAKLGKIDNYKESINVGYWLSVCRCGVEVCDRFCRIIVEKMVGLPVYRCRFHGTYTRIWTSKFVDRYYMMFVYVCIYVYCRWQSFFKLFVADCHVKAAGSGG
jgi:hypothetical protein